MRKRAPNLQDGVVSRILGILDDWQGPLTWPRLLEGIRLRLGAKYSRSAMASHKRVQAAYSARKAQLREVGNSTPSRADVRERYIQSLKARLERVERENHTLLERFVRWLANAEAHGLSEAELDRPLIPIDKASRKRKGEMPGSSTE